MCQSLYVGYGSEVGGVGDFVVGFNEKNATVNRMNAIQMIIAPIKIMLSIAPISNTIPAVPNIPTPDLEAINLKDFR